MLPTRSMHNLLVTIKLYDPYYRLMGLRQKLCKVKIPTMIQPVFFDEPVLLEKEKLYRIIVQFDHHEDDFESGSQGARFRYKTLTSDAECSEDETFPVEFVSCDGPYNERVCLYTEAGQVRVIYFWPVVK